MPRMDEAARKQVRAGPLMQAEETPAEAAHAVGVARLTAQTREALVAEGGVDALSTMARG
jgi:hypothetical protein